MGIFGRKEDKEDTSGGSGDHRTASNKKKKNIIDKVAEKSVTIKVIKGIEQGLANMARPFNVKRRKKFITKYNTRVPPSERISMSDDAIGSVKGLASLKDVGYKTISDMPKGPDDKIKTNTSLLAAKPSTELQKAAVKAAPVGPTVGDIGNVEETEEQRLLRIKRKGRRATKLAAEDDELYLSQKALLG